MFSLTRARINSEILLLIRINKVMVTGIIHQCEEMLLPGKRRSAQVKKESLKFNFLYGDLFYQTPGALTKAEYQKNPQAARPAAGAFPSADGAKAAIYQKTWYGGFNNHFKFNDHFENSLIFMVLIRILRTQLSEIMKQEQNRISGKDSIHMETFYSKR
jgi:outer membrane receptor for Fe3+-dicitrate